MQHHVDIIAQRLRQARKESGLTLQEVSVKTGWTISRFGNYEQARREPGVDEILVLSKLFNRPPSWLLGIDEPGGLSEKEEEVINKLRNLTPEQQKEVDTILNWVSTKN